MIFLIEYDRPRGHIVQFKVFSDSERAAAQDIRLEIELNLNRSRVDHEVVLLEAMSEEAVRRTHRRYFENPRQIVESTSGGDAPP